MAAWLVVCGDPGGANAVVPVLSALHREGRHRVNAIAYREARDVWSRAGLAFEEVEDDLSRERAGALIREKRIDLLLTGTSGAGNALRLEAKFTAAARRVGIPSIALLDFWSDYRVRFGGGNGPLRDLPDRIAVMDQQARDEMIAVGFEPERIAITGHPAFDMLREVRAGFTAERRAEIRAELGLRPGERLVLFLSQPIGALFAQGPADPRWLGFTEREVHRLLINSLERIALRRHQPILLVFRPHPRERLTEAEVRAVPGPLRTVVSTMADVREIAQAADLVTGMFTILLLEAFLMGCPVLSLQPGLAVPDLLPTNRSGLTRAVYTAGGIEPALEEMLFSPTQLGRLAGAPETPYGSGATTRIIRLAESLLVGTQQRNSV